MSEIKCLKDSETKKYIIPTNEWLKPLEPLVTGISTKGKMMLAKMVNKQKVVVKLTKNVDIKKIKNISGLVNKFYNFPKIYCVFQCAEDETNFDTNYLDTLGFCKNNKTNSDSTDPIITLEIMKLYKHKLSEYYQKLSVNDIKIFMKQLVFGLLHAFQANGFIHGDLHIDNILLNLSDTDVQLKYTINKRNYSIDTQIECIITDFDRSILYDIKYLDRPKFVKENTIIYSIYKIIQMCGSKLYKKENKWQNDPINIMLDKVITEYDFDVLAHGTSILGSFYTNSRSYDEFVELSLLDTMDFINVFWKELYNEYLFLERTLENNI
jgi:serine/threonine protein kinase